jgi:hypothetical protein
MATPHSLGRGHRRYNLLDTTTVSSYPPRDGLLAYWSFNEGVGSIVYDYSGNNYTSSLAGTSIPTWNPGKIGSGLSFGPLANSSYVSMGTTTAFNVPSLTYCGWYNIGDLSTIASTIDCNNQANFGWALNVNQDGSNGTHVNGKVAGYFYSAGQFKPTYSNAAALSIGTWTHLLVTYAAGGNAQMYINGSTTGTTAVNLPSGITYSSNVFTLGRDLNTLNQYSGSLDEVMVYNRVLTSDEISQIYNQM